MLSNLRGHPEKKDCRQSYKGSCSQKDRWPGRDPVPLNHKLHNPLKTSRYFLSRNRWYRNVDFNLKWLVSITLGEYKLIQEYLQLTCLNGAFIVLIFFTEAGCKRLISLKVE